MYFLLLLEIFGVFIAFNKYNINIFIKKYKVIYNNFNILNSSKIKKVLEYYINNITYNLKSFSI